mgnify:CR=1 FL=1
MKQFILLFFGLAGTAAFSDVTTPVCPEPRINGSDYHENLVVYFATILGSRNSVCGMYSEDKLVDVNPASISIPPGQNNSSCEEIQCRAWNAEIIVTNAKTVIELSNEAVNGEIEITQGNRRRIRAGIRRIERTVPDWETFLLRPYTEYTYVDAEEYIARSLEALTLRQVDLLPAEIMSSYLLELRRIEEAERQRVEEERRRAEEERRRAEAERQRVEEERRRKTIESGIEPDRYYVTAEVLNVRDAPKTGTVVDTLSGGEFVRVVHQEAGWGQLESTGGGAGSRWVNMGYLARVKPSASDGAWGGDTIALTILLAMAIWVWTRMPTDKEYQDAKKSGDEKAKKKAKRKTKRKPKKDATKAWNFDLSEKDKHRLRTQELAVQLAIGIGMADGSFADKEGYVIKKWIKGIVDSSLETHKKGVKGSLNEALEKGFADAVGRPGMPDLAPMCKELKMKSSTREKYDILELCLDVMAGDELADKEELDFIRKISNEIGLPYDEFRRLKEQRIINIEIPETEDTDIHKMLGIDPDWDDEKKKQFIIGAFSIWNNRLSSLTNKKQKENAQKMVELLGRAKKKYG